MLRIWLQYVRSDFVEIGLAVTMSEMREEFNKVVEKRVRAQLSIVFHWQWKRFSVLFPGKEEYYRMWNVTSEKEFELFADRTSEFGA